MKAFISELHSKAAEFCGANLTALFWIVVGLALHIGFLLVGNTSPIADEGFHIQQIQMFLDGNYSIAPKLTVPPVYHAIFATIYKLLGFDSIMVGRLISFSGSACSILIFYLLAKRISPEERNFRTLQFIFLPIIFPFFFLIYTDIWALGAVLLSTERALAQKAWQSALAMAFAVALRPPNIVWAAIPCTLILSPNLSNWRVCVQIFARFHFKKSLPCLLLGILFTAFISLNHGVAVGDRKYQQIALNFSNIWFFLLLFPIFFWPTCLSAWKDLFRNTFRHKITLPFLGALAGFSFYFSTYHISHVYNNPNFWFFIRNRLLFYTTAFPLAKAITFIPIAFGGIGFISSPLLYPAFILLIPLTLFSIIPFPLIEQRYYIVPITLFLLFRKLAPRKHELINTFFYIVGSLSITFCISRHLFFF